LKISRQPHSIKIYPAAISVRGSNYTNFSVTHSV